MVIVRISEIMAGVWLLPTATDRLELPISPGMNRNEVAMTGQEVIACSKNLEYD